MSGAKEEVKYCTYKPDEHAICLVVQQPTYGKENFNQFSYQCVMVFLKTMTVQTVRTISSPLNVESLSQLDDSAVPTKVSAAVFAKLSACGVTYSEFNNEIEAFPPTTATPGVAKDAFFQLHPDGTFCLYKKELKQISFYGGHVAGENEIQLHWKFTLPLKHRYVIKLLPQNKTSLVAISTTTSNQTLCLYFTPFSGGYIMIKSLIQTQKNSNDELMISRYRDLVCYQSSKNNITRERLGFSPIGNARTAETISLVELVKSSTTTPSQQQGHKRQRTSHGIRSESIEVDLKQILTISEEYCFCCIEQREKGSESVQIRVVNANNGHAFNITECQSHSAFRMSEDFFSSAEDDEDKISSYHPSFSLPPSKDLGSFVKASPTKLATPWNYSSNGGDVTLSPVQKRQGIKRKRSFL